MAKPKCFRKLFRTIRKYVFKTNTEQKLVSSKRGCIASLPGLLKFLLEYAKLSGMAVDELDDHHRENTANEHRWDLRLGNK